MGRLLHIESSSTVCSVAISNNDELLALKELNNGYTHAENLHVFIQQILDECNMDAKQVEAVAISSGPGSYTGLRIGFSAAKGLAYALNIPLITIDTLKVLCVGAMEQVKNDAIYIPLMDARRMEVYCAGYDKNMVEVLPLQALILNEENSGIFKMNKPVYFFGDGMPKAQELLAKNANSHFIEGVTASASYMVTLAQEKFDRRDFSDVAYSEPNYLKEFFFNTAKK